MTREEYLLSNSIVAAIHNINAAYASDGVEDELVNSSEFWDNITDAILEKASLSDIENTINFFDHMINSLGYYREDES